MATTISGTVTTGVTLSAAQQNPLSVTATGYVTNTMGSDGVLGEAGYAWTVANSGTIKTTGTGSVGILLESGGSVTNGQSGSTGGLIESAGIGVEIFGSAGSVTNFGTIEGTGSSAIAVFLEGGTVTNFGSIEGTGSLGFGVLVGTAAATVDNLGTIEETGTYSFGVALNAGGAVTNRKGGLIAGGLAGVESGTAATVVNYGTIEATGGFGVLFGSGASTLTNAGTISGTSAAVAFSGGGNRVILDRGEAFLGTVFAGSSSDVVELAAGGGTGTVVGSFSGFGVLTEDAGADWQMPGHWSFVTGSIATGAILELPATHFVLTGSLTNGGTIGIDSGATLMLSVGASGAGDIAFAGSGDILQIGSAGAPAALANPITGFAPGDTIDMAGLVADGDTYSGGVLTLTNQGNAVSKLTLATTVPDPVFTLGTDGSGGTLVTVMPSSGYIIPGTITNGVILSNPARQDPATVTATGYVTNQTTAHGGDAVYGTNAAAWNFTNLGTIKAIGVTSDGIQFVAGGTVTNGQSGSTAGLVAGARNGVSINGSAGTVVNFGVVEATGSFPDGTFATGVILFDGGSVENLGTIQSTGPTGSGVNLQKGGNVANGQRGSVAGSIIGYGTGVFVAGSSASITNYGTIEAIGTAGNGINLTVGGSVINGQSGFAGGLIAAPRNGIIVSGGLSTVVNSGIIAATGTPGTGISLLNSSGGRIINASSGLIAAASSGVSFGNATGGTGTAVNQGIIEAFGSITNSSGSIVGGNALVLNAGGSVQNGVSGSAAGLIVGYHIGILVPSTAPPGVTATVRNFGTIESLQTAVNGFDGAGVQLDRGGTIANYGLISGQLGIVVPTTPGATGTVTNLGTIEATGSFTVSGTIALYPDAVRLAGGGMVTNGQTGSGAGLITAGWVGVDITNGAGTLVNFGTVQATGTVVSPKGFLSTGVVISTGIVINGAAGATTALITSDAGAAVYMGGIGLVPTAGDTGTVSNFGMIANTGTGAVAGHSAIRLAAGGSVFNTGLVESVSGAGISIGATTVGGAGTVTNFGAIVTTATGTTGEAIYLGAGGTVTNYGVISGAHPGNPTAGYAGVVSARNQRATVVNLGAIINANNSNGVNLLSGGTLINGSLSDTTASITAPHSAVYVGGTLGTPTPGATGFVYNYGTITNGSTAGPAVRLVSGGIVTNRGLISSARTGVSFGDTAGTVVNLGTIVSTAPLSGTAGTGVYLAAGGSLTNASGATIGALRTAVSIGNTFATSAAAYIHNQGVLTGDMGVRVGDADTGDNTLTNGGSIIGTGGTAVKFGSGSDLLTVDPGAVFSGLVDGGAGSNTLELAAAASSGTLSGIGTNFVDFAAVDVDTSAVWLLSGANTLAAGTTLTTAGTLQDGGTLVVGGSFVDSGLVTIESGATLELLTGGTGSGSIAFAGSGDILQIGSSGGPASLANPITGFATGDTIDMAGLVATGASYAGGVLTLANSGTVVAQLTLSTPVVNPVFTLSGDGSGGTIVTVAPKTGPVITAPATATVGVGQPGPIAAVSIAEAGNTSGETFTTVLADTSGVLAANTGAPGGGGTITSSNGGRTLTIAGTLAEVNADLTTLTDTDALTAADTITVNASDSDGGMASPAAIAVTVNGVPAIAAPATATAQQNQATAIAGISVSETGNTTAPGPTFTTVLADTSGVLAANTGAPGGGGTITSSNGGRTLTIAGTLAEVNADLTTLTDTDASIAPDTITVNAGDSFGNAASPQSIAVNVLGPTTLLEFVFTYNDGKDYYYGAVADNGLFGYHPGETVATASGQYQIFADAGAVVEAPGTVSVTYYSHGGPGQASYTPVMTAAGKPDGSNGLGHESDLLLGTDGQQHPFGASREASFTTSGLYGFVFNYADGVDYYFGTVADDTAPNITPPGANGSYQIFSEGSTAEPSGTVIINGYRDGKSATTFPTVHPASGVDGTAGLGSETGSYVNGTLFTFNDSMEATDPPNGTPSQIAVLDTTTGSAISAEPLPYSGPVNGLQEQYVYSGVDSLNVAVSTGNWFIHTGGGNDAIAVTSGTNVLDGGTGSNFLTGGSGTDTFFVDDRSPAADIWSTVSGFHRGDAATIFGISPNAFNTSWFDGQGAAGYTGVTLHATAPDKPTASLTLVGYSSADLQNGRLSVSFGAEQDGIPYMYVLANS